MKLLIRVSINFMKSFVGLFSDDFRSYFRKNNFLLTRYSSLIRRVGYFPGSLSKLELQNQYKKNLSHQRTVIDSIESQELRDTLSLVVVLDVRALDSLPKLVDSIAGLEQSFSNNIILTDISSIDKVKSKVSELNQSPLYNMHIVSDLRAFSGEFFAIRGNDRVHPSLVKCLCYFKPKCGDIGYVDIDKYSIQCGSRHSPKFFPDWNPELHLTTDYIKTGIWGRDISALSRTLTRHGISFDAITKWMTLYYLSCKKLKVSHIPLTLVHTIEDTDDDRELSHECSKAIGSAYNCDIDVVDGYRKLSFSGNNNSPLVSIVIPTRNAMNLVRQCIESIYSKTSYPNFEILLVDNNSDDLDSISYFSSLESSGLVTLLHFGGDFNYSAINNFAVERCNGEIIALLNNDIEVVAEDWLDNMVGLASLDGVGAVGAKLLYPNNTIQHAGVVLGYGGGAGHAHKYFPYNEKGYLNRIAATNCYSAVTAACLVVTKSNYDNVKGLNETDLSVAFNDVDFCLKLLNLGKRNIYCAEAVLYHHESVSRGLDNTEVKRVRFLNELKYLQTTWCAYIDNDCNYNLNLTTQRENFSISQSDRISSLNRE
ncbi:glycosyltransferase [Paraglaciecola chathamensis]|uniref:glycosyltransferase family 2 protein n=1 Tax=Paraglaciecola chathamensis TaxID=368405 RepID=UPI0026F91C45|nr:glycosyltransferase [Paraglaciecola chathamensis]MDO6838038.1 glycosyltransferase [Paraglaciecola chathamensis]